MLCHHHTLYYPSIDWYRHHRTANMTLSRPWYAVRPIPTGITPCSVTTTHSTTPQSIDIAITGRPIWCCPDPGMQCAPSRLASHHALSPPHTLLPLNRLISASQGGQYDVVQTLVCSAPHPDWHHTMLCHHHTLYYPSIDWYSHHRTANMMLSRPWYAVRPIPTGITPCSVTTTHSTTPQSIDIGITGRPIWRCPDPGMQCAPSRPLQGIPNPPARIVAACITDPVYLATADVVGPSGSQGQSLNSTLSENVMKPFRAQINTRTSRMRPPRLYRL